MLPRPKNLLAGIPSVLPEELKEELARGTSTRIERIVSRGHPSAPGFWYDQPENEWVVVLAGRALLGFEGGETVQLETGDSLEIPAHVKHRVEWTDPDRDTVWLAVFYG